MLVLLAPIGLDAGCWNLVELSAGDVIKHEFPGFGSRPRADRTPSIGELADEVAALGDELDIVGVSMGGMVAQHVAIRHPDRVRSALVACTGTDVSPQTMFGRAQAAEELGMPGVIDETMARWFTDAALAEAEKNPGVAYASRTLLALDPRAFADGWRTIATHDARAELTSVKVPVTCVAGRDDAAASPERVGGIASTVQNGRLVVVDGPHMLHLEQPAVFSAALADHLGWRGQSRP